MVELAEEKEEPQEQEASDNRFDIKRYTIPFIVSGFIITFILGMLFANYLNSMALEQITGSNENTVQALQEEKAELRQEKETALEEYQRAQDQLEAARRRYNAETEQLSNRITMFSTMIDNFGEEGYETRTEYKYYYELEWDKFIAAEVGETITTEVQVENTGTSEKTYDIEVLPLARYNQAIVTDPVDSSLTLDDGSSGTINLKFTADAPGYAVYGLYVNDHYSGDIVIMVTE